MKFWQALAKHYLKLKAGAFRISAQIASEPLSHCATLHFMMSTSTLSSVGLPWQLRLHQSHFCFFSSSDEISKLEILMEVKHNIGRSASEGESSEGGVWREFLCSQRDKSELEWSVVGTTSKLEIYF